MAATLPAGIGRDFRYYVGGVTALAPAGWNCTSSVGADGSASMTVRPIVRDGTRRSESVAVSEIPACQGCMADLTCPYFPEAEQELGYSTPCPTPRPRGVAIQHPERNVVSFTRSDGADSLWGVTVLLPPSSGRPDSAAEIECELPAAKKQLCEAIVSNYLAALRKRSSAQLAARWPSRHTTPTTAAQPGASQPGYLALASNGVLFIQWTRAGHTVIGTLSESYANQSNPAQLEHESHSFTGVVSGSSITLKLDTGENWTGTLNGSSVTLSYTAADGTLATFTFTEATVSAYNRAVALVAAQANHAANEQAQAQATQQSQKTLNEDAATLASDISGVQSAVQQLNNDVKHVPNDLRQMRADLATQKNDLGLLITAGSAGCQNGDEYQVTGTDNYQVTSTDDYQITSTDAYAINNDEQAVSQAVSTLKSDSREEQTAQAALPSYTPTGLPSAGQILQASSSASVSLRSLMNAWHGYLATVRQLDASSNTYASEASRACGS